MNRATKNEMRTILAEIQNGRFARQWIRENRRGRPEYARLLQQDLSHPIETVGRALRKRMPWLKRPA